MGRAVVLQTVMVPILLVQEYQAARLVLAVQRLVSVGQDYLQGLWVDSGFHSDSRLSSLCLFDYKQYTTASKSREQQRPVICLDQSNPLLYATVN